MYLSHKDFDEYEDERHKCGEFDEKGFRFTQCMPIKLHAFSFRFALGRRHASRHKFVCILVGRIESRCQSRLRIENGLAEWECES